MSKYVPSYGKNELEIDYFIPKIVDETIHNEEFTKINELIESFKLDESAQILTIAICEIPKSGKTSLSARIAKYINFPYTKIISNNDMVDETENYKKSHIKEIFENAFVTKLSVVVIDEIETIVEYYKDDITSSSRMLYSLYNSIKTMIKKKPMKNDHKVLVIINYDVLKDLDSHVDYLFNL